MYLENSCVTLLEEWFLSACQSIILLSFQHLNGISFQRIMMTSNFKTTFFIGSQIIFSKSIRNEWIIRDKKEEFRKWEKGLAFKTQSPVSHKKERILDSLSLNGYWIQHRIGKAIIIDIKHWMDNVKKQRQESQEKKDKTWERKAWKDRETIDYWPEDGERILKVTKKSGNRGRCRKLCLWKWLLNSLTIQ